MDLTPLDTDILTLLSKNGQATQAEIIRALLPKSGESYICSRIRTLEARALLLKERRDATNTRTLSLTKAGREALTTPIPQEG